jgi:aromatic-L-amino-acid decarboxylase
MVAAMKADRELGLVPFFVMGTCGTTGTCSFDQACRYPSSNSNSKLQTAEIAEVCRKQDPPVWFHIDAAYAGAALVGTLPDVCSPFL